VSDYLPSIAPNQAEVCMICGASSTYVPEFNDAHTIKRSAGGTETVRLCLKCHNDQHAYGWKMGHTPDYFFVLDRDDNLLVKRWFPPADFDEGLVVAEIEQGSERLTQLSRYFKFMSDEGIHAIAEALTTLGLREWHAEAKLLQEAKMRTPYGDKRKLVAQLALQWFGMGASTAYRRVQALEIVEQYPELSRSLESLPAPEVIVEAAKAPDPVEALNLYRDRRASGRYSLSQFKAELKQENPDAMKPPPEWHLCPECSQPHVRKEA